MAASPQRVLRSTSTLAAKNKSMHPTLSKGTAGCRHPTIPILQSKTCKISTPAPTHVLLRSISIPGPQRVTELVLSGRDVGAEEAPGWDLTKSGRGGGVGWAWLAWWLERVLIHSVTVSREGLKERRWIGKRCEAVCI